MASIPSERDDHVLSAEPCYLFFDTNKLDLLYTCQ